MPGTPGGQSLAGMMWSAVMAPGWPQIPHMPPSRATAMAARFRKLRLLFRAIGIDVAVFAPVSEFVFGDSSGEGLCV